MLPFPTLCGRFPLISWKVPLNFTKGDKGKWGIWEHGWACCMNDTLRHHHDGIHVHAHHPHHDFTGAHAKEIRVLLAGGKRVKSTWHWLMSFIEKGVKRNMFAQGNYLENGNNDWRYRSQGKECRVRRKMRFLKWLMGWNSVNYFLMIKLLIFNNIQILPKLTTRWWQHPTWNIGILHTALVAGDWCVPSTKV